jgi:hypothetical protein
VLLPPAHLGQQGGVEFRDERASNPKATYWQYLSCSSFTC